MKEPKSMTPKAKRKRTIAKSGIPVVVRKTIRQVDFSATINSIKALSAKVDRVILFHSGAGKDSIALLNMMSPYFKEIVCVYMYMVKDLEHINRYILWAEKRYPNCRFIQTPHYA